ncbi:MAG TPA: Asp-tRNA(Asn)/Glu-tRNA(Gln) amidotransferase subunit GatA [Gemmatimonadales bacterium]|nr:Asp-tRNA(Asn)/Glu-tRNA(Gln) amidotransferase subunit GatA [Gemmatimonadales bacterium]
MSAVKNITEAVRSGRVTSQRVVERTEELLRKADQRKLNAALEWSPEYLGREAGRLSSHATRSAPRPLLGVPVAVKDNIATLDLPTTCASRILDGYISPFEATAVKRLRDAGAFIACKANMDEFAMGSSTEWSAFGRVQHPEFADRVPGGSSGGSAALVAAGVTPVALGSETGGSVRQPASFCGIVGVKPTYGRVSRHGLVAFGSSLDCISVFGEKVDDAARLLSVISGHDPLDATSAELPPLVLDAPRKDLKGLTLGLPDEYFPADLHKGVRAALDQAIAHAKALGATIKRVSLPHAKYSVPTYYIVNPAEAAANLARFDGVRYGKRDGGTQVDLRGLYRATRGTGFGPEVRRRILVGTYVLSAGYADAYYHQAMRMRTLIAQDFTNAFAGVDLLLTPTTPTPAFKAGDKTDDPVAMYLADVFVAGACLAGIPAMSIPAGRSEGLPVGMQLLAPAWGEAKMLAAASAFEGVIDPRKEVR